MTNIVTEIPILAMAFILSLLPTGNVADWVEVQAEDHWSSRSRHAVVVLDDKIWVLGGYGDGEAKTDIWYIEHENLPPVKRAGIPHGLRDLYE